MNIESHKRALSLMDLGDLCKRKGQYQESKTYYFEAAQLELSCFDGIPSKLKRTRAIIGLSVASLYFRAGEFGKVVEVGEKLLGAISPDQVRELNHIKDLVEDSKKSEK